MVKFFLEDKECLWSYQAFKSLADKKYPRARMVNFFLEDKLCLQFKSLAANDCFVIAVKWLFPP